MDFLRSNAHLQDPGVLSPLFRHSNVAKIYFDKIKKIPEYQDYLKLVKRRSYISADGYVDLTHRDIFLLVQVLYFNLPKSFVFSFEKDVLEYYRRQDVYAYHFRLIAEHSVSLRAWAHAFIENVWDARRELPLDYHLKEMVREWIVDQDPSSVEALQSFSRHVKKVELHLRRVAARVDLVKAYPYTPVLRKDEMILKYYEYVHEDSEEFTQKFLQSISSKAVRDRCEQTKVDLQSSFKEFTRLGPDGFLCFRYLNLRREHMRHAILGLERMMEQSKDLEDSGY